MANTVWITDKINAHLDAKVEELGAETKEGLVNAILILGLTNKYFLQQAYELHKYLFEGAGVSNLEESGL